MSSHAAWRRVFVTPIALFILSQPSAAQQSAAHSERGASTVAPDSAQTSADLEIALLRETLEVERRHNGELLSTVYWSLGTTATIALALLGFGWFVNFRVYQRDMDGLSKSVQAELTTAAAKIAEDLKAQQEARAAADRSWQAEVETHMRSRISTELDSRFDRLTSTAENNARRIDEVRLDYLFFKADSFAAGRLAGSAFTAYIEAARLAHRLHLSHMVSSAISRIDKLVRSLDGLFESDIQKLTQFLASLEDAESTLTERLAEAIRAAKVL